MKKTFVIFSSALLIMSCGGSSNNTPAKTDSSASTSTTTTASPDKEKALELIGASDCHTCHKLNKDDAAGGAIVRSTRMLLQNIRLRPTQQLIAL